MSCANVDGHDSEAIDRAIVAAKAVGDRPSLICCKTVIAKGAPTKAGTHESHGAPLGEKEIAAARAATRLVVSTICRAGPRVRSVGRARVGQPSRKATGRRNSASMRAPIRRKRASCSAGWPASCRWNSRKCVRQLTDKVREKAQTIATRKASQDVIEASRRACRNCWAARRTSPDPT